MGAAPIHDDKKNYSNLYGAKSWWQIKIKSLLPSANEPSGIGAAPIPDNKKQID